MDVFSAIIFQHHLHSPHLRALRPRVRFQSLGVPPRVEDRKPRGAVGEAAQAGERFAKQDDSRGREANVVDDEFA
ncbi:hypothetical protein U1Q18_026825 [Sarracenia purpurea var. burkii]